MSLSEMPGDYRTTQELSIDQNLRYAETDEQQKLVGRIRRIGNIFHQFGMDTEERNTIKLGGYTIIRSDRFPYDNYESTTTTIVKGEVKSGADFINLSTHTNSAGPTPFISVNFSGVPVLAYGDNSGLREKLRELGTNNADPYSPDFQSIADPGVVGTLEKITTLLEGYLQQRAHDKKGSSHKISPIETVKNREIIKRTMEEF